MTEIDLSKITQARFIKLGWEGCWENLCLSDQTLRLGFYESPHELALTNNAEIIRQCFLDLGIDPGIASRYAGQILEFYRAGPETLWITFANGMLWWCIATGPVEYLGDNKDLHPLGSRLRKTTPWQNSSLGGKPLIKSELSGHLTSIERYPGASCRIKEAPFNYLIRKIKDAVLPEVEAASRLRSELQQNLASLIQRLTPEDFELFTDLIFSQGGWRRISQLGKTIKTIDLELLQPMTGERAMVQVKSETTQRQLEEYIERFEPMQADRYFYVYHTTKKPLVNNSDAVTLLGPGELANHALNCGLLDWLVEKVG